MSEPWEAEFETLWTSGISWIGTDAERPEKHLARQAYAAGRECGLAESRAEIERLQTERQRLWDACDEADFALHGDGEHKRAEAEQRFEELIKPYRRIGSAWLDTEAAGEKPCNNPS